jgi:hypothetical protein
LLNITFPYIDFLYLMGHPRLTDVMGHPLADLEAGRPTQTCAVNAWFCSVSVITFAQNFVNQDTDCHRTSQKGECVAKGRPAWNQSEGHPMGKGAEGDVPFT